MLESKALPYTIGKFLTFVDFANTFSSVIEARLPSPEPLKNPNAYNEKMNRTKCPAFSINNFALNLRCHTKSRRNKMAMRVIPGDLLKTDRI